MYIVQGMRFWNGYGFGILRGFTVYYSALFTKFGYRNNPFEIPAYDQKFRFMSFCEKHNQHGIKPEIDTTILKKIYTETPLIFRNYQFHYAGNYFILAISFVFCLILALIKPLIDGFVFLIRLLTHKNR